MGFLKFKKQFWILLCAVLFLILVSGGSMVGYLVHFSATNAKICETCHPKIGEAWRNSHGHPAETTTCYECHSSHSLIPPEYIADDDLTSKRCLDCHPEVLELGYELKKKIVKFTHRYHREEGLECVDCHRTAGHAYEQGGTNRPTAKECMECHFKEFTGPPKSQKCLNCHDVMLAPGRTF